jgi:hypothetical protein
MPDLDNHMDDLFRRAADNYPLKTTPGNWDDLVPVVGAGIPVAAESKSKAAESKSKRKMLLLLLAFLITGGTVGLLMFNNAQADKTNITTATNSIVQTIVTAPDKTVSGINAAEPEKLNATTSDDNFYLNKNIDATDRTKMSIKISGGLATSADNDTQSADDRIVKDKPLAEMNDVPLQSKQEINLENKKGITKTDPELKKENETQTITNVAKQDKKKKDKPSFYFGLTGGAELSQVKGQGMTSPGLNGGLVAGLQLSKQLAVETGIQFSQKKYYSQGKHFNPKASDMPSNMTVNSLDGSCILIEIPLTVKYNFSKKKNGFYTAAGVSSYIMTKEKNNYQATVSGQSQQIKSTYSNTKAYLSTDLNFSAGYQQSLGKRLNIRVEPYLQIPLKGIGIGSMPVMSTGVHLVLTRNK